MLKAVGTTGTGDPLILLGITSENFTRLLNDEVMLIDLAELGLPPGQILLVGGRDERHVMEGLEGIGLVPAGAAQQMPDPKPGQRHVATYTDKE